MACRCLSLAYCPVPAGLGEGHVGAVGAVAFARRGGGFLVTGGADKLLKVGRPSRAVLSFSLCLPAGCLQLTRPSAFCRVRSTCIRAVHEHAFPVHCGTGLHHSSNALKERPTWPCCGAVTKHNQLNASSATELAVLRRWTHLLSAVPPRKCMHPICLRPRSADASWCPAADENSSHSCVSDEAAP